MSVVVRVGRSWEFGYTRALGHRIVFLGFIIHESGVIEKSKSFGKLGVLLSSL